jgi:AcrR family transcriptional regulator
VNPDQPPPRPLPRGRHSPGGDVVAASQRTRALHALVELVAEHGYGSVKVGDVTRRAGVSLSSFYRDFDGKEAAFLAAYDSVVEGLLADLLEEVRGIDDVDAALDRAVTAYFAWFADRPAAARTFLVEIRSAGTAALERRTAAVERFLGVLAGLLGQAGVDHLPPPRPQLVALAASIEALAHDAVVRGRVAELRDEAPAALDIVRRLLSSHPTTRIG